MEKVVLTGYLGNNAEVVRINNEERFISASVAPIRIKDRDSDSKYLRWYQLNCALGLKALLPSLVKGTLVAVTGELRIGAYEKEGKAFPTATVYVNTIEILSKKGEDGGSSGGTQEPSGVATVAPMGSVSDDELPF